MERKTLSNFITSKFVCITVWLTARYAKAATTKQFLKKVRSVIIADFVVWVTSIFLSSTNQSSKNEVFTIETEYCATVTVLTIRSRNLLSKVHMELLGGRGVKKSQQRYSLSFMYHQ